MCQVQMEVVAMGGVGLRTEHGTEHLAGTPMQPSQE